MDAAITKDDKTPARGHDENQDAIVFAGLSDAKAHERLLSSLLDASPECPGDGDRDLSRCHMFGSDDRFFDTRRVDEAQ